ncbi:hypothetical protein MAR_028279, partial [Mya arenaria]
SNRCPNVPENDNNHDDKHTNVIVDIRIFICVLHYIFWHKLNTVMNFFIVNLDFSDISMSVFCIPLPFIANLLINYWSFGKTNDNSAHEVINTCCHKPGHLLGNCTPLETGNDEASSMYCVMHLPTAMRAKFPQFVNDSNAPYFCEELWGNTIGHSVYNVFVPATCPILYVTYDPRVYYDKIILVLWIIKTPSQAVNYKRNERQTNYHIQKKVIEIAGNVAVVTAL